MRFLFFLNRFRWYTRLPLKGIILAFTVAAVCFPYPSLLFRQWQRARNPNAMIDAHAPGLEPITEELRKRLPSDLSSKEALKRIERFVYEKVPYEWDWNTWGVVDYLPSVEEVLQLGKEDCDGRAVLAASLMRNLGYEVQLVSDFAHMWVKTNEGELMNPGQSIALVATEKGWELNPGAVRKLIQPLAYGISVFPVGRELIVLAVGWWLFLRKGVGLFVVAASWLLLLNALFLLRLGSDWREPQVAVQVLAMVNLMIGIGVLWRRGSPGRGRSSTFEDSAGAGSTVRGL